MSYFPNPITASGSTTSRSLQQRFSDVFNVKDFGATGSYDQDATTAVQAAVNAALTAQRAAVYFPAGEYRIGPVTIGNEISLIGDGTGSSEIYFRDTSQTTFTYVETSSTKTNVNISGLSFSGVSQGSGRAIYIAGSSGSIRINYVRIRDCFFALMDRAVHLRFCANIWLNNLQSQVCTRPYYLDTCGDTNFTSCQAQNGTGYGYTIIQSENPRTAASEGLRLVNCSTNGQKGITADTIHWANIIGGSFTTGIPAGTQPVSSTDPMIKLVNCHNWRFEGTDISFAGEGGFWGPGFTSDSLCERVQLNGCLFALNTTACVLDGKWNTITGCVFTPNGTRDLDVKGKYSTIMGNTCASGVSTNVTESGTANYNAFTGNICSGNPGLTTTGANSIKTGNITTHPNN